VQQPGWYHADGDPPDTVRYWDGVEWADEVRPAPARPDRPPPTGEPLMRSDRFGGLGIRIAAGLIDGVIQAVVVLPLVLGVGSDDAGSLNRLGIVVGLVAFVVRAWLIAVFGGTPGKLLVGLRVTAADGMTTPPGAEPAVKRSAVDLVGLLPVLGFALSLGVGILSVIYVAQDPERRSVYDRVGGTRVVRSAYL
jgi:uncharacterized RDD family membrane protein YckC